MKQDMTEYLNNMTSGSFDTLEKIISLQYRKFVRFYKLVKEYSSLITKLKYTFVDGSTLNIVLVMDPSADMKSIKKELESSIKKSQYEGSIKIQKKNFIISLTLQEK